MKRGKNPAVIEVDDTPLANFKRPIEVPMPNHNYRFRKDSQNLQRRMNCMRRRRIHRDNIVSLQHGITLIFLQIQHLQRPLFLVTLHNLFLFLSL